MEYPVRRVLVEGASAFEGYPSAVSVAGLLFISGVRPLRNGASAGSFNDLPKEAWIGRQGFALAEEDEEAVAVDGWISHDVLDEILAAVGSKQEHMLRTRIWQRDKRFYPSYERVRVIRQPKPSASSGHSVSALVGTGARAIGIDGVAIAADDSNTDRHAVGATAGAKAADRPLTYYSVAAQHGDYAFLAGHIPVKAEPGFPSVQSFDDVPPEGRKFATNRSHTDSRDGPISAQTWYVYDRIRDSLFKIGATMDNLVHCLVGLEDLRDLPMFHRVHRDTFGDGGPALTIVGAGEVGHRRSRLVVEPTVYMGKSGTGRIEWPGAAPLSAPLARRAGKLVFISGMAGIDRDSKFVDHIDALPPRARTLLRQIAPWTRNAAFPAQCWQAWSNLAASLTAAGSRLEDLVKLTVFLADPADWAAFEAVRREFIDKELPAIECVAVPFPGPTKRSVIQIDSVAYVP